VGSRRETAVGVNGLWNEKQLQVIAAVICDELENSRLAHRIVAKYAIPADARSVMADKYDNTRRLIDDTTPPLVLQDSEDNFSVTKIQAEDPVLTSALQAIRRHPAPRAQTRPSCLS
jgi:hypothetical protein